MLNFNKLYISLIISFFVISCSTENPPSLASESDDVLPIYYKKSIHKYLANNQTQIDDYCSLLKSKKSQQLENYLILGSWFGKNNSEWLNLMITSANNNNMISGFLIKDTIFRKFTGWYSSPDNTNFKLGITDEGHGVMSYYDLNISLETMKIEGYSSVVSAQNESLNKPIVLFKRNFDYNITSGQYPEFSQREIEHSELEELSKKDLNFICEEILARHGHIFFNEKSRNYFSNTKWYSPRNYKVDHLLTELEKKNLDKIYKFF